MNDLHRPTDIGEATSHPFVVAALYKFVPLPDFKDFQKDLLQACKDADVYGTLLLATEGINGTIAGSRAGIDAALGAIRAIPGCDDLEWKESFADENPFYRMKVRLKKEIVTMGVPGIDPNKEVGTYVSPQDWNALISDPSVLIIDTRNDYEVAIGTFKNAIDPKTTSFREFVLLGFLFDLCPEFCWAGAQLFAPEATSEYDDLDA